MVDSVNNNYKVITVIGNCRYMNVVMSLNISGSKQASVIWKLSLELSEKRWFWKRELNAQTMNVYDESYD